ncbi:hypothetical protein [Roseospira visakhapatnamensis]|uniref:Uncharacterized protein n=1 Tax=Roseospira visakhapatnamensis TaxID=390880 RepID=A0A7W6RG50_9PROT|nr:hypothetical protein [Roseospira visakhapatnamensis]MBB4267941.1 hypothetical protein [Roseospira visakhapatnamensis]
MMANGGWTARPRIGRRLWAAPARGVPAWGVSARGVSVAVMLLAAGLGGGLTGHPGWAKEAGRTIQYGRSTAPFWQVGAPDTDLSKLCRRGQFNQKSHEGYYIGYYGKENPGRGYTGIAKQDYNLFDPTGKAKPDVTYHFFNDGYSNCKVYAAPDPEPGEGGQP